MRILTILALTCFAVVGLIAQNALILEGATILDGVGSRPRKNAIIVIEYGKITGYGSRKEVIFPAGAKRINLRGKFVMPGLVEIGRAHV